jgi:hypothetical protein
MRRRGIHEGADSPRACGKRNRRVVRVALKLGFEVVAGSRELAEHRAKPATASSLHAERPIPRASAFSRARRAGALAEETAPPHGRGDGRAIGW